MKQHVIIVLLLLTQSVAFAQYSERNFSIKQQAYTDSLKKVVYNHTFPIFGQKAYQMGIDLTYPVGIMANYFYAKQGLILDNFQLGFDNKNNSIPLTPADFIGFKNNTVSASSVNIRPDVWVFPFLDVYGVFGYGSSTTTVNITTPVTLTSVVTQNVSTAGFGFTGAFGFGYVFTALDMNFTWNKPEKLDKPVPAEVLSMRVGHTFHFREHPGRNLAFWVGAMRAKIGSGTVGQITLSDALPPSVFQKKDEIVNEYYTWYNNLNPNNPADQVKKAAADKVLTPIIQSIDAADGSGTIHYAMEKRPVQEWNMIVGGQFQLNKRFIFRSEGGIIGDRKSFLLSVNYRFMAF
jgi:hypothetical protein